MVDAPSGSTDRADLPYPLHSQDPKWIDNYIKALAEAVEKVVIPKFAGESARDAAITVPVKGDMAWLSDTDVLQVFDGSTWAQVWPGTQPTITHGTGAPS